MNKDEAREYLSQGRAALGIELGSTRIKAVLIGADHAPLASGSHDWENRYENGVWTYALEDVWTGIQDSYRNLAAAVQRDYGVPLTNLRAIGVSAMMHGYLPFDAEGNLLVPFRTWRNTMTEDATVELTKLFRFNIPQRWSIAHLYHAILQNEPHVADISFLTTLAGYVHWQLTGEKVLGVGDASGMFPIDSAACDYDAARMDLFSKTIAERGYQWTLRGILPRVLPAGAPAGVLTPAGAKLLDPSGALRSGIPLCPPEGDAGTGMAATNSVAARTGNVSAGTSVFAMVVLEKPLKDVYTEIDMVTTPTGKPVAMVHCNSCTSDINAWASMLCEFVSAVGGTCTMPQALDAIFYGALRGDDDCGGLVNFNYFSGEPITGLSEGRPLFARTPDAAFTFANFARAQLFSSVATLRLGMDILLKKERVQLDSLMGHGGFFKAAEAGQRVMAAAMQAPVSVMETAGEGGPWGMALLAAYMAEKQPGQTLEEYLAQSVFAGSKGKKVEPQPQDTAGFAAFMKRYEAALAAERAAVAAL